MSCRSHPEALLIYTRTCRALRGVNIGSVELYDVGFDATWEVDMFGGTRRAIEAAAAEASAVEADLADTHVQLSAEIAQAYVDLRDQQQRIVLVRESAELEEQVLTLTQQRRAQGVASDLDVERIRTQVENTRGTLIPLDAQITESLDQLATLTGREPGALDAELTDTGALPALPETIAGRRPGRTARSSVRTSAPLSGGSCRRTRRLASTRRIGSRN